MDDAGEGTATGFGLSSCHVAGADLRSESDFFEKIALEYIILLPFFEDYSSISTAESEMEKKLFLYGYYQARPSSNRKMIDNDLHRTRAFD
jgi:hypothetical protein